MSKTARIDRDDAAGGGQAAPDHGGDLASARRHFGDGDWLDLSTGINPVAYPLPPLPPELWTRLPQPDLLAAAEAAARTCYGAPAQAGLVTAPGTQALIQLLPTLWPPGPVAIVGPTYGEYARAWQRAGHAVTIIAEPDQIFRQAVAPQTAVVVNPNNPDGRHWPADALAGPAAKLAAAGGLLVVDESFGDVLPPDRSAVALAGRPGLAVLRSFGKFFGLAGLRLGFLLTSADLAATVRDRLGPWAVSGPALAVAATALADQVWIAGTRRRLARDAARLDQILLAAGLTLVGGTDLFRLVQWPGADRLRLALARRHILSRSFGHSPDWLRLGLPGDDAGFHRLAAALPVALAEAGR